MAEHAQIWIQFHKQLLILLKSNFTLWTTEYIFTVFFYFNRFKYCNELAGTRSILIHEKQLG